MGFCLQLLITLFRLEKIARQEARQKRIRRKLLEKQRKNREPVPIFQVQERSDMSYHNTSENNRTPPDLICRNQLYRVWGAVPPATELWERRRALIEEKRESERFRHINREEPDGGEDDTNNDEPSIETVIQTAKEVRRLINNSSCVSLHSFDFESVEITDGSVDNMNDKYSEETPDLEYISQTNTDFRDILQLTSIEDNWSDTRSVTSFSSSLPRLRRRQSVLSNSSMDIENWEWEDMTITNMDVTQDTDIVIRCGDIITSDTSINM